MWICSNFKIWQICTFSEVAPQLPINACTKSVPKAFEMFLNDQNWSRQLSSDVSEKQTCKKYLRCCPTSPFQNFYSKLELLRRENLTRSVPVKQPRQYNVSVPTRLSEWLHPDPIFQIWAPCILRDMSEQNAQKHLNKCRKILIIKKIFRSHNPQILNSPNFIQSLDVVHPESISNVFESHK